MLISEVNPSRRPLIGFLTHRHKQFIAGKNYAAQLTVEAQKHNCKLVVYSPADIDEDEGVVSGNLYDVSKKKWLQKRTRLPDIVYDRFSFMGTQAFKKYAAYRKKSRLLYANNRFAHKWNAHRVISRHPKLSMHLPETAPVKAETLADMLRRHKTLYAKPVNGSGGKDILKIKRSREGQILFSGRDAKGTVVSAFYHSIQEAEEALQKWCRRRLFILQQGLSLSLLPGMICDCRVLVQKNRTGNWQVTGTIGKYSPLAQVTSNLQGGGKPIALHRLLEPHFSLDEQQAIRCQLQELSLTLAHYLETIYGRFIEFGLDFGIDTSGRVWLIEVNTKPNRELFRLAGEIDAYLESIACPIEYACYLIEQTYLSGLDKWKPEIKNREP
ncbi:YheC/YheD family protein [Aneurinibacillus sp. Ricciae_BoGa-3]|uniref:YheC/YheD family endospore coat-associated protein n=1 Tax=Aneurinibacillus sp. Ricciae_BoGa-3 TaxID=3022697 RepID=UPI00234212FB|nr:YheC/YheD family protein [Aneurinibacillus sp. Ricciae_BoGa-3]WCK55496.1 YheC/YheD family protein [Aneurinibacillus sp. Ricciae_BoGa-3]